MVVMTCSDASNVIATDNNDDDNNDGDNDYDQGGKELFWETGKALFHWWKNEKCI